MRCTQKDYSNVTRIDKQNIYRLLRYERVYLPLYKVADTPFHILEDELTSRINRRQEGSSCRVMKSCGKCSRPTFTGCYRGHRKWVACVSMMEWIMRISSITIVPRIESQNAWGICYNQHHRLRTVLRKWVNIPLCNFLCNHNNFATQGSP